jgi:hypothetical protein
LLVAVEEVLVMVMTEAAVAVLVVIELLMEYQAHPQ